MMVNIMDSNSPGSTCDPVCDDFASVLRDFNLEVQVMEVRSRDRIDTVLAQPCSGPGEAEANVGLEKPKPWRSLWSAPAKAAEEAEAVPAAATAALWDQETKVSAGHSRRGAATALWQP